MTVPLLDYVAPDGTEVLIAWLSPLGDIRDARPSGAPLPFRQVHRIGGGDNGLVDKGLYSVSTFDSNSVLAQQQAWITHRRVLLLAPSQYGYIGQSKVTLSDGSVVQCDEVKTIEAPREVNYAKSDEFRASSPYARFTATYQICLRFVAAT